MERGRERAFSTLRVQQALGYASKFWEAGVNSIFGFHWSGLRILYCKPTGFSET